MNPIERGDFPLPDTADPRTAGFFAAARGGELAIPKCDACRALCWYPAPRCPSCGGSSLTWTPLSGRGRLYSWTVVRRAFLPAFEQMVPFATGLVALDEDPAVRVVSYIVDCDPSTLVAGQPVRATFRPLSFPTVPGRSVTVPMFAPDTGRDP
jgi:uncharacterized OB-fold protein